MNASGVVAIVLAAGRGTRFGGRTKQLAVWRGRSLVSHVVDAALDAHVDQVRVILGHAAADVSHVVPRDRRVRTIVNPSYADGQASSLQAGFHDLPPRTGAVVVVLGDQPTVTAAAIEAVGSAVLDGAAVARAEYDDGPSHPVAFGPAVWPDIEQLTGDVGARALLAEKMVTGVALSGQRPRDVDTMKDLAAFRATEDDCGAVPHREKDDG